MVFNIKFVSRLSIKLSQDQEIFNDYYVNKTEVSEEMKVLDLKGDFMNPEIMKKIAE